MTKPGPLGLPTAILLSALSLPAQEPDAATLDRWWRDVVTADESTRAAMQALLDKHRSVAIKRGILLLRSDPELARQGLAFAIAEAAPSGFHALLREVRDEESPARTFAFDGAWQYARTPLEGGFGRVGKLNAMQDVTMECLGADDEELLQRVAYTLRGINPRLQAMLERRLGAEAPIGPRAAVFRHGRTPRPPLAALQAALEDPSTAIRDAAARALRDRDVEKLAEQAAPDEPAPEDARTTWNTRPWPAAAHDDFVATISAQLPATLDQPASMDLRHRRKLVQSAARRLEEFDPDAAAGTAILTEALRLPTPSVQWIGYQVDTMRAIATRALLSLGDRLPADAAALIVEQATRESIELPLLGIAYVARFELSPPPEDEHAEWSARCRRALGSIPAPRQGQESVAAAATAGLYDALGRLGAMANASWLRERMDAGEVARGAAAGALFRLAGEQPAVREAVAAYLRAEPGKWPHDAVLAHALANRGADSAWAVPLLLDRLPRLPSNDVRAVMAHLTDMALPWPPALREGLRDDLLGRLRAAPVSPLNGPFAEAIVALDPAAAIDARDEPGFGTTLLGAFRRTSPERLVPLLDSEHSLAAHFAHDVLVKSPGRQSPAATRAALSELLQRERLRNPDRVLEIVAKFDPTPDMLPMIATWLPESDVALRAMVAVGEAAVPRIAAFGPKLQAGQLRLLVPLGEHGEPLIQILLGHEDENVRKAAPSLLPYFGAPGLDALRRLQWDEKKFCHALVVALRSSSTRQSVRLRIADELLLHPSVEGIAKVGIGVETSKALAMRLLLLKAGRDPHSESTTTVLLNALASTDPMLRAFALRRLADNPDRERVAGYVRWMREDPEPTVQRALRAFDADGRR